MSDQIILNGGVYIGAGRFYLLTVPDEAEDDECIVCAGRRDGDTVYLRELTELGEIQRLIPLTGPWLEVADAAALTPDGDVIYLRSDAAQTDPIPGAGYHNPDAKDVGRMTGFAQVGGSLVAMGYGGQVYLRSAGAPWTDISLPVEGGDAPAFFDVCRGGGETQLLFGGSVVTSIDFTEEMDEANEDGDADRLADLLLAAAEVDAMALYAFDGTWRTLDVGSETSPVAAVTREADGGWLAVSAEGTLYRTEDLDSVAAVLKNAAKAGFDDVKDMQGVPLFLYGNALSLWRDGTLQDFEPALPAQETFCLSVSPQGHRLAAFFPTFIEFLDGSDWIRLSLAFEEGGQIDAER